MKNKEKSFDTVLFFRKIKQKLSDAMQNMSLQEKKKFLRDMKFDNLSPTAPPSRIAEEPHDNLAK